MGMKLNKVVNDVLSIIDGSLNCKHDWKIQIVDKNNIKVSLKVPTIVGPRNMMIHFNENIVYPEIIVAEQYPYADIPLEEATQNLINASYVNFLCMNDLVAFVLENNPGTWDAYLRGSVESVYLDIPKNADKYVFYEKIVDSLIAFMDMVNDDEYNTDGNNFLSNFMEGFQ